MCKSELKMNLTGKVVLVTGGLSGIGASCVEELVANNVKGVLIADISDRKEVIDSIKDKYGSQIVTYIHTDISNKDSFANAFEKTIERYGNIDVLINCAGILDEIDWERTIQVNLVGTTYGCLLAINKYFPKYKSSEEVCIVNIASTAGIVPLLLGPHYASTKHGVIGLTRSLGMNKTISAQGVRVMALCPGATETAINQNFRIVFNEYFDEELATYKYQKPEIVAKSVVDLLTKCESGSVWLINEGVLSKVELPLWENVGNVLKTM